MAQLALARARLRTGGTDAAGAIESALSAALALVEQTGAAGFEPLVRVELAELAQLCGDADARRRELHEARRLFVEIGAPARAAALAEEPPGRRR
jgi:hypothetical protein